MNKSSQLQLKPNLGDFFCENEFIAKIWNCFDGLSTTEPGTHLQSPWNKPDENFQSAVVKQ